MRNKWNEDMYAQDEYKNTACGSAANDHGVANTGCLWAEDPDGVLVPGHLKEMIISRLPIQEAFRTSILSTNWRHTARGLSQLVFEDRPTWSEAKFIDVVDHVLSNHGVGLIKFMVSGVGKVDIGAVDRWVSRVSDLFVQELTLRMSHGSEDLHHRIFDRLYTNHQLTYLHLTSCSLVRPPRAFTGFRNLKKIVFYRVFMPQGAADMFFGHCQSLE
ncbi:PREDICTED: F-box/FBD/LRR-repeat protein At1g13570-like [Fragaria vesca subsp. vesca]|uniref:F-box/FBD/LRR-repeat protein At1g13570-like n=1 Tax=Fragaria vesca subsp. vesca TaxID=101020 RepID=UPI0002C3348A|nr:PREDICTED: F-box/FBD/LRR-repeat protein At1g13570-like [Fragaria vesca subsp. vesca]